ncbi:MAG: hypothetical protein K2P58_07550 [Hyphomonadaceae bacterium]|nr:hypothetical protein [Hyphomonadaceae bacterium]
MLEKREGEPCPICAQPLQRRRSTFRTILGDVAYCARCSASYELAEDNDLGPLALKTEAPAY